MQMRLRARSAHGRAVVPNAVADADAVLDAVADADVVADVESGSGVVESSRASPETSAEGGGSGYEDVDVRDDVSGYASGYEETEMLSSVGLLPIRARR